MACKGLCDRHKAKRPDSIGRYADGQRRCQTCSLFLNWSGVYCPCCGYKLRSSPRDKVLKKRFKDLVKAHR